MNSNIFEQQNVLEISTQYRTQETLTNLTDLTDLTDSGNRESIGEDCTTIGRMGRLAQLAEFFKT